MINFLTAVWTIRNHWFNRSTIKILKSLLNKKIIQSEATSRSDLTFIVIFISVHDVVFTGSNYFFRRGNLQVWKNLFSEGPIRRISEVDSGVPESGTCFHTLVTLLIKRPPLKKSISEKSDVPDKNPGCPDKDQPGCQGRMENRVVQYHRTKPKMNQTGRGTDAATNVIWFFKTVFASSNLANEVVFFKIKCQWVKYLPDIFVKCKDNEG